MPNVSPFQGNFSRGEVSPLLHGRVDVELYRASLAYCQNYLVMPHGILTRRPGTRFSAEAKFPDRKCRLIPFEYSEDDSYMLEVGHLYIRVYRNYAHVEDSGNPGNPYEITTTITEDQLAAIDYTQIDQSIYLVHKDHAPKELKRTDHDNWTLTDLSFTNKPSEWTPGNFPRVVVPFQSRLGLFSTPQQPHTYWLSMQPDNGTERLTNFTLGTTAGSALKFTINQGDRNEVMWAIEGRQIIIGTSGGTRTLGGGGYDEPLTVDNIFTRPHTKDGAARMKPISTGAYNCYLSKDRKRLFSAKWEFTEDGIQTTDMSELSEHILSAGVVDMAYTSSPFGIIWCALEDGQLVGITYRPEQEIIAPTRHHIGGSTDANPWGEVESVASIPQDRRDVLYMVVKRKVGGVEKRFIEYLDPIYRAPDTAHLTKDAREAVLLEARKDAYFMDCGGTANTQPASSFTGWDHLNGETVDLLADGVKLPQVAVASGGFSIGKDRTASKVSAGLPTKAMFITLRTDYAAAQTTEKSAIRRTYRTTLDVMETGVIKVGTEVGDTVEVNLRKARHGMGKPPPLTSGDIRELLEDGFNREGQMVVEADGPLPCTVRSIVSVQEIGAN